MNNKHICQNTNHLIEPNKNTQLITYAAILLTTLLVYCVAIKYEFITYDDEFLLTTNPNVNTGISLDNIVWAFTSTNKLQWVPLTWLSHMIDFSLYGMRPYGHHLTNVILHMLNVLLLLLFFSRATNAFWRSAFVVFLFALHPLHVEPVAWISARKDLLSTFFCFWTLIFYLNYVKHPRASRYIFVLGAYLLSLVSKPMMVTLPFILLLLDYWPLRRFGNARERLPSSTHSQKDLLNILFEKVPLFIHSLLFCLVANI